MKIRNPLSLERFGTVPKPNSGDMVAIVAIGLFLSFAAALAVHSATPNSVAEISRQPGDVYYYAGYSFLRMCAAYILSLAFSIGYGYAAARVKGAHHFLLPILDVLQSVPILSFLPVALLSLSVILPQRLAAEMAAILLIFTSQAWNMTFSFYQSLITTPKELGEVAKVHRLSAYERFKFLELPFSAIGLVWNSVMSWSGGWFFLMASETFRVSDRDFRLPGLGSFLQSAADAHDIPSLIKGVAILIAMIVVLDQCVWRPLLSWVDRFRVEYVSSSDKPQSWFRDAILRSKVSRILTRKFLLPVLRKIDRSLAKFTPRILELSKPSRRTAPLRRHLITFALLLFVILGSVWGITLLSALTLSDLRSIVIGLGATLLRVIAALLIGIAWTVPLGVLIGSSPKLARFLQPVIQILAALPATALFPLILLALIHHNGGLNMAAVGLMLLGTQWYILFNIITGASSIPQDLKDTTDLLRLGWFERWRTLIFPALFPFFLTGLITASGGAWNASIVAERVEFGGVTYQSTGIGSLIAEATSVGNYPVLLGATLGLIMTVLFINRFIMARLFRMAEEKFRLE